MSLVINTNSVATTTRNYLNTNQSNLQRSLGRLASGSRIVKPSDDAGGLAVGSKLTASLNRNTRAQQNVQNSISFLQVQDGALASVGKILDRMSELKTMSLDVTKNSSDIANYDAEFNQLQDQLANIRDEKFNGINLFTTDSSTPGALTVYTTEVGDGVTKATAQQVDTITGIAGDGVTDTDTFTVTINGTALGAVTFNTDAATTAGDLVTAINGAAAGVTAAVSGNDVTVTADTAGTAFTLSIAATDGAGGSTVSAAASSSTTTSISTTVDLSRLNVYEATNGTGLRTSAGVDVTDSATATSNNLADYSVDDFVSFIQNTATARATNGAQMSRLEQSSALLTTNNANIESARSRLMDVDIATESTQFAKHNILVQSSAAMLAQANSVSNVALQLLG